MATNNDNDQHDNTWLQYNLVEVTKQVHAYIIAHF